MDRILSAPAADGRKPSPMRWPARRGRSPSTSASCRAALTARSAATATTASTFPPARPASTLLAIYPGDDGELAVPLTVRHGDLRSHAGEVSLPGGAVDADRRLAPGSRAARGVGGGRARAGRRHASPARSTTCGSPSATSSCGRSSGPSPSGRRSFRTTPRWPRSSSCRWPPSGTPMSLGVEEIDVRGVRLRAGAYRYGGVVVWGATAMTLGMLADGARGGA